MRVHSRLGISFLHIMRIALLDLLLHRMRAIGLVLIRLGLGVGAQVVGILLYASRGSDREGAGGRGSSGGRSEGPWGTGHGCAEHGFGGRVVTWSYDREEGFDTGCEVVMK